MKPVEKFIYTEELSLDMIVQKAIDQSRQDSKVKHMLVNIKLSFTIVFFWTKTSESVELNCCVCVSPLRIRMWTHSRRASQHLSYSRNSWMNRKSLMMTKHASWINTPGCAGGVGARGQRKQVALLVAVDKCNYSLRGLGCLPSWIWTSYPFLEMRWRSGGD